MKLEIEVTEDEVRSAIERKVRVAISEHVDNYWTQNSIKEVIKKHWSEAVDNIVREELENSDKIRETVQKMLEHKIKSQLTNLLKSKEAKQ